MSAPIRIQRQRTKGWRMPENTVYVGRPTRWGNPWREGGTGWTIDAQGWVDKRPHAPLTREQAIESFRNSWEWTEPEFIEDMRAHLRGKNLACWCPLWDSDGRRVPCHADVLLELANGGTAALRHLLGPL